MHTPIPLFLSVGVGGIRSCPAYRQFWGVLWGLWAVFWLFVGKHMALHKFGSQSILRLQNRGVFWGGVGFSCWGGLVGCWQSLGSTASNCGKGLPKVLQQLRQGCRICSAVGSVMLVTVAGLGSVPVAFRLGSVAVRPGCPCLACCPAWLGFVLRCCVSGCRLAVRLGCLSW